MASTLERKSPQVETATGRFFAYLRISEADSYDDALVDRHKQRCREYFEVLQASGARLEWGDFVVERDVTCFDWTLQCRRQGELLHRTVGAGDVVVFPDILRSFRDSDDLRWTWKLWQGNC